jgi:hypothetical protein
MMQMKCFRRFYPSIPAMFLFVLWAPTVQAKNVPGLETAGQLEDARKQSQSAATSESEDSSAKAGKAFQGSNEHKSDQTLLKFGKGSSDASLKSTTGDDIGSPLFTQAGSNCPEGSIEAPDGGCIAGEDVTPEECKALADKAKTGFWSSLLLFLGAAGLIGLGIALGWTGVGLVAALAGGVLLMAAGAFLAHQGTKSKEELKQNPLCGQAASPGKGIGGMVSAAGEGGQTASAVEKASMEDSDAVACEKLMRETGRSAKELCDKYKAGQCCGYGGGGGGGDGKRNCTCSCGQVVRLVSCTDQTAQKTCATTCRDKGRELCAHNWGASSPGYAKCYCSFRTGDDKNYDEKFNTCRNMAGIKEACASSDNNAYLDCIVKDGCDVPIGLRGTESGRQAYQDCLKNYLAPAKKSDAEYLCKDVPSASKTSCACSLQNGKLSAGTCLLPCGSAFYDPRTACCSKGSVLQDQILGTDGKCTPACDGKIGLVRRADGTCGCPNGKILKADGTCVDLPLLKRIDLALRGDTVGAEPKSWFRNSWKKNPGALAEHKNVAVTAKHFSDWAKDKSLTELVADRGVIFKNGQPGEDVRYVRDPANPDAVIDMRHFLCVGDVEQSSLPAWIRASNEYGYFIESWQWMASKLPFVDPVIRADAKASAFDPQDFYSNALGAQFFRERYNPDGPPLAEQLREFFKQREALRK